MRNINELIGIINGISDDGIIDEKETDLLRSWVAQNRNLVYASEQAALIARVEAALEDGIIDDDERTELLNQANAFVLIADTDLRCLYELLHFFDDILCNEWLDKRQHDRLAECVNDNRDILRSQKEGTKLVYLLDKVLENSIVSEEDFAEIRLLLSECIELGKFEAKLAQLARLVREKKNIGIELIEILDNTDAIAEINRRAEDWLKKGLQSYSGTVLHKDLVYVSLVLIAMLKYDGNYYNYVRETYTNLYNGYYSEQKIEGTIRSIIKGCIKPGDDISYGSRVINIALSDSIVPVHYLPAFFEFIYDIYKLNFDYDLPENLYDEFSFIYDGLKSLMTSDDDVVTISVTKKSYKLIRSTKRLITNDQLDSIIKLSIIVSKLIDKKVWDKENPIFNPYLKEGYLGWLKTLREDVRSGRKEHSIGELRSKWEPEFVLSDRSVYIVPPIHKVKALYNPYDIHAIVTCNGKVVAEERTPYVSEIIGGYKVKVNRIRLNAPLNRVRYQLMAGSECIYDSKDKLFRECIAFTPEGTEISNNTDYSGGVVLCHRQGALDCSAFFTSAEYCLSMHKVRVGNSILVGNTLLNFSAFTKPGVFGTTYQNAYIKKRDTDELIDLYKEIQCLYFESNSKTANFEISINEKPYRLTEFGFDRTETERGNKYVVNLNLMKSAVYSIRVWQLESGRKQQIFERTIAVDSSLTWDAVMMSDTVYLVSLESDLARGSVYEEMDITEFGEDFISFTIDDDVYYFILPFSFDVFRISNGKWMPYSNSIWIGDVNSESYIELIGTTITTTEIRGNNGACIDAEIPVKRLGNIERIPIGFLLTHKAEFDYVVLAFAQMDKPTKAIFCYNKCIFDESGTEISFSAQDGELTVTPKYFGKGNIYYTIQSQSGELVYKSGFVKFGESDSTYNIHSFEHYRIQFYEKEKGLSLKKENPLAVYDRVFYSIDEFVGRSFKIDEVYFDQSIQGELVRKSWRFNRVYLFFTRKVDEGLFEGELYTRTKQGSYMLNRINPVEIEICGDIIDEKLEISITKDGDGLLLDFEHSGIKNTLDDLKATDIFSYIIDANGVETA